MTPTLDTRASPKEAEMSADGPVSDTSAFNAIYCAEMRPLLKVLTFSGFSYHDACDAAQIAMMALYVQGDSVRNPAAWLRTVAFRNVYNNQSINELSLDMQDQFEGSSEAEDQEHFLEQDEVCIQIRQLPVLQRQVFALSYDGYGNKEIADILQITEAAARQNLSRARRRLKGSLTPSQLRTILSWDRRKRRNER